MFIVAKAEERKRIAVAIFHDQHKHRKNKKFAAFCWEEKFWHIFHIFSRFFEVR
jgi:hypothetical protein